MKKLLWTILCGALLFLYGCGSGYEIKRSGYYLDGMVLADIYVHNSREVRGQAEKFLATAFSKIIELDTNLNKLSPISEISAINSNAAVRMVEIGELTYDLLRKSLAGSGMTDGYFDITWLPLVRLFEQGAASSGRIELVKRAISYQNLQLDTGLKRIRFLNGATEIDFERIKRGYAVDLLVNELSRLKIKKGSIKAGTVAYYYNGVNEKLKIADGTHVRLNYKRCGVATVGAETYYQNSQAWRRYLPVETTMDDIVSVTVIAPNATTAEVLANACFFMGIEKGLAKIKDLKSKTLRRSSYDVVIVYRENNKEHAVSTLKVRGRSR